MNKEEWWEEAIRDAQTLADIETVFRRLWPSLFPKPIRRPLLEFPDVIIHAEESAVKKHPLYATQKRAMRKLRESLSAIQPALRQSNQQKAC